MTGGSAGPLALAAVDLGASSGRVMLGRVGPDGSDMLQLTEVARFRNGGIRLPDGLYWDVLGLYVDILAGVRAGARRAAASGGRLAGLAIDSWAGDYGLLGPARQLLGNPALLPARVGPPPAPPAPPPGRRSSTTSTPRSTRPGCTRSPACSSCRSTPSINWPRICVKTAWTTTSRPCSSRTCSATGSQASGPRRRPTPPPRA